ncbi:hypothetical protein OSB04_003001 [Centaurea solstitialis]|uniref:ATP-dependent DNA helicase n=1 Tax=Centaurea solstitialis TaxID=347529 RepID=A0AA38WTI5_9ASTR|nr:hypothetical protein OSB04_003001 [Centaurea solstitialis]
MCNIKKQSGTAQLLQAAKIIIWDEASITKRQAVEAFDRIMQDITGVRPPFGGKIVIMRGNFRQVLPVTRHDFLLRVGTGDEESLDGNLIRIPDDMAIPYTNKNDSKDAMIDAIFFSLQTNGTDSSYIISRAILTTKNEHLIERFCGEEKVYYSFDETEDDKNSLYPVEFLNSLNVGGLPPHYLRLKIGCPIMLLRNIDPSNGLCNGTRLICRGFQRNIIDAEIAVGQHAGKRVFLPRIPLCPSEYDMFSFKLKKKQFSIRLCFAVTINKAQGQTIRW